MNKTVTSKEEILAVSRQIVAQQGLQAINMRTVAAQCGVAVGSIYNYFPSKNDLIIATIEAVWKEITQGVTARSQNQGFLENTAALFETIKTGGEKYPSFLSLHAISLADGGKDKGKQTMNEYFHTIQQDMLYWLQTDSRIQPEFFSENCTPEDFVAFIFSNIMMLLARQEPSCDLLIKIIKKTLY
ncbi:MAG: TetR/AcrR family transcriptional regulator [Massiliimalia sp.]|jgi:AcrR family transcriptional regulator